MCKDGVKVLDFRERGMEALCQHDFPCLDLASLPTGMGQGGSGQVRRPHDHAVPLDAAGVLSVPPSPKSWACEEMVHKGEEGCAYKAVRMSEGVIDGMQFGNLSRSLKFTQNNLHLDKKSKSRALHM